MDKFSNRLQEALTIRKISAAELSRIIGVNEGTISNYKKGVYEPKQRRLECIAKALNVSIPWLMGADVPMNEKTEIPAGDDRDSEIIRMFSELTDDEKKSVLDYIAFVLSKRSDS